MPCEDGLCSCAVNRHSCSNLIGLSYRARLTQQMPGSGMRMQCFATAQWDTRASRDGQLERISCNFHAFQLGPPCISNVGQLYVLSVDPWHNERLICTCACSALLQPDGTYAPARMLPDGQLERVGRGDKAPKLSSPSPDDAAARSIPQQARHSAAIVVVGDEILSGRVEDVNTRFLCMQLRDLGWQVSRVRLQSGPPPPPPPPPPRPVPWRTYRVSVDNQILAGLRI